ncbi:MAG: signal recognition particle-docking protein FtsY [Candidatus Pacearchaeota archaeon]|nr:signal recognition particle-docking protein FtsY [Candidatus Pacearchaeota archaeon]
MFGFLKKKIKEFITGTKEEIEKEEKEKEQELKQEIEKVEEQLPKGDEEIKQLEEKKEGLFSKLKKVFTTTKLSESDFDKFFDKLELALIENNVAMEAIHHLNKSLKYKLVGKEIKRKEIEKEITEALKTAIDEILIEPFDLLERIRKGLREKKPYIIIFFGINGSGKTTTIAKIAHMLKQNHLTSILAASDTFRAASIEQLEKHASKLGVEVIKQKYGADPAAVAFDAIAHAKAKGIDVVLIDTAGRMHTKQDLLREMEKICRVAKPDIKIFVGEAITGNDAIEQAKAFNEAVGIDAIILTKADVDEKGGATISVSYVTKKPILFLGVGQEYGDLKIFDKTEIIKKIFD